MSARRVMATSAAAVAMLLAAAPAAPARGDTTPPTAPSNLRVVSVTSSGVELAWNASTDASAFDYHVTGHPCSPLVVSGSTPHVLVPSIDLDPVCGLLHGFTDTFAVRARDEFDNDSAFSNTVTVAF
jgi:chitinase